MTEEQIKTLEKKVDIIVETLKKSDEIRENNAKIIDNNFEILNQKIDAVDKKVNALHSDTQQNFDEVKLELVKIQKTTGYDEMYDNLKVVNGGK